MKSLARWITRRLRLAVKNIKRRDEEIQRLRSKLVQLEATVNKLQTENAIAVLAHEALKTENARLVAQMETLTAAQADVRYGHDTSTQHTEEAFECGQNVNEQLLQFRHRRTSGSPTVSELIANMVDPPIPTAFG